MAGKSAYKGPALQFELFEAVVAAAAGVERRGVTIPYTSRNGHMFSFLDDTGAMALRLPAELRTAFLARYGTEPVEQHGAVMKEYVAIPDTLLRDTEELRIWFEASHAWVGTLKPKGTSRGKKA